MTVLINKLEVSRTDVALLVKKLVKIYTTPTPKGWHKTEKVICID